MRLRLTGKLEKDWTIIGCCCTPGDVYEKFAGIECRASSEGQSGNNSVCAARVASKSNVSPPKLLT